MGCQGRGCWRAVWSSIHSAAVAAVVCVVSMKNSPSTASALGLNSFVSMRRSLPSGSAPAWWRRGGDGFPGPAQANGEAARVGPSDAGEGSAGE